MSKPTQLSNERGIPLVRFLWDWKLVSTAAISKRFFPRSTTPFTSYNWLLRLRHEGYVGQRWDEKGKSFYWTLDRAGFSAIRTHLPPLREEGFRSEHPEHDGLASALHLGAWLVERPAGVQVFTEQQLRRLEIEEYPAWVPKDLGHRPDGYWHTQTREVSRTVALEMEISRKKAPMYQTIGSFYAEMGQINRVLWVVRSLTDAARIAESLKSSPGVRSGDMHSFVKLDSFRKQGWSAQVASGPGSGLTIQSFLCKALSVPENDKAVTSPCHDMTLSLLETRIRQRLSVPSGARREGSVLRLPTTSVVGTPAPHETRINVKPEVSQ